MGSFVTQAFCASCKTIWTNRLIMLKIKKSRIPRAGKGLFTTSPIRKGDVIVEYDTDAKITSLYTHPLRAELLKKNKG